MSVIRLFSRIGLFLLGLLAVLIIVVSARAHEWRNVFMGIGFLSFIAFLADILRVEALKQLKPEVSVRPNLKIMGFFFFCAGIGLLVSGINALMHAYWWLAAKELFFAAIILFIILSEWYFSNFKKSQKNVKP